MVDIQKSIYGFIEIYQWLENRAKELKIFYQKEIWFLKVYEMNWIGNCKTKTKIRIILLY